jgi:Ca2+-binding EF-hand superfamily protein
VRCCKNTEYQEFQIIFGTSDTHMRARKENYKKLQALRVCVPTDSVKPISARPLEGNAPEKRRQKRQSLTTENAVGATVSTVDAVKPLAIDLKELREDLCSDMVKLQELIMKADTDSSGVLDKFAMLAAVNQCTGICKRTAAVEVALECADTTGTGTMININVAMQRMCEELVRDVDREHMEGAQEALRDKRTRLVEQTEAEGSEGFIEAKKLREVLTAGEFGLAGDVVSSIMRFFGVRDEGSDSVRIPEITRSLCPSLDQIIFAGLNSKVMAKYGSLKTGFDALSKGGKISRQQLSELLQELDSQMRRSDVDELVRLADADGSGSIEYQEFQIIFGTGEVVARTRQANFKKLQQNPGVTAALRTDSIKPSSQSENATLGTKLSAEERVAEVLLGSRESELRAAFKDADSEGKDSLDMYAVHGAFNKLGLGLSAEDVKTLLSKTRISSKGPIDYNKLLTEMRARLSTASTLEEAQAEIVTALRDLMERKGEDKMWLVNSFRIIDRDVHLGEGRGKMRSNPRCDPIQ